LWLFCGGYYGWFLIRTPRSCRTRNGWAFRKFTVSRWVFSRWIWWILLGIINRARIYTLLFLKNMSKYMGGLIREKDLYAVFLKFIVKIWGRTYTRVGTYRWEDRVSINLSIYYLSIYLYVYSSIYLSIYLSLYLSIYLSIYLSTFLSIYQCFQRFIKPFACPVSPTISTEYITRRDNAFRKKYTKRAHKIIRSFETLAFGPLGGWLGRSTWPNSDTS